MKSNGKKANKAVLAVLLAVSSLYATSATITSSLPLMVDFFKHIPRAELLVKLALTLPALFIAIIAPISGNLSDRFGRKKILILGLILYGIGGFSPFFLTNLRLILVGRALLGLGLGSIFSTATTLIGDYFSGNERRKVLSLQGAFVSLGGLVFVGGAGFLAGINWRLPFLIYLVSFLILPAALFLLKEPETHRTREIKLEYRKKENPLKFVFINFSAFICMVFFLTIHTQLPFFLQGLNRNSTSLMGTLLILFNLVGFFSATSYSRIRQKFSHTSIYGLFFIFMGLGFYFMGLGLGYFTLFSGILFCGISAGLVVPNTSVWLQEITAPDKRGRMMGIMTSSLFLGQFLSPVVMQPVLVYLPEGTLFQYVGIFMLFLGIGYGGGHFLFRRSISFI